MHAVINHLTLAEPITDEVWARAETEIAEKARSIEGFEGLRIVRLSETDIVLLVFGADAQTLDRIASEVGGPWMVANVVPHLAAPPDRRIGEVLVNLTP